MIITRYVDMPATVKGYVVKVDDCYTIILNSRLNFEQNKETYKHELLHIYAEDFLLHDADAIERRTHE